MAISGVEAFESLAKSSGINYVEFDPEYQRTTTHYKPIALAAPQVIKYTLNGVVQTTKVLTTSYAVTTTNTGAVIWAGLSIGALPLAFVAGAIVLAAGVAVLLWDDEEAMIWTFTAKLAESVDFRLHPSSYDLTLPIGCSSRLTLDPIVLTP